MDFLKQKFIKILTGGFTKLQCRVDLLVVKTLRYVIYFIQRYFKISLFYDLNDTR